MTAGASVRVGVGLTDGAVAITNLVGSLSASTLAATLLGFVETFFWSMMGWTGGSEVGRVELSVVMGR